MITLESFKETISLVQKFNNKYEQLKDAGIDIIESWLMEIPDRIFNSWVESNFNSEGADLIYWWLYESVDKVITINDVFGESKLDISTVENFYKYLFNNKYIL